VPNLDQGLGPGLEHKGRQAEDLRQSETMRDMDPKARSAQKEVHKQDHTNHGDFVNIIRKNQLSSPSRRVLIAKQAVRWLSPLFLHAACWQAESW
jgi:hypothetical protein